MADVPMISIVNGTYVVNNIVGGTYVVQVTATNQTITITMTKQSVVVGESSFSYSYLGF